MAAEPPKTVKVRTTLPVKPLPLSSERPHIRTERLILRTLSQDDLHNLHTIRTQPEVMIFTPGGRPDKDLAETQKRLDLFLPPNDNERYNWGICLTSTGELIGVGGVHRMSSESGGFSWPEMGYMFKREHWGMGYGTEGMKGFVDAWWKLPREEVEVEIEADAFSADGQGKVPEQLSAIIDLNNSGSRRILEKLGFRKFKEWKEADSRAGFEGMDVTLALYVLSGEV